VLVSAAPLIRLTAEVMSCWGALLRRRPDAHLLLYPFGQSWTNHPALAATELDCALCSISDRPTRRG